MLDANELRNRTGGVGSRQFPAPDYSPRLFRARVLDFIGVALFPASRAEIIAYSRRHNTPSDIVGALLRLSQDGYGTMEDLLEEVVALGPTGGGPLPQIY